MVIHINTDYSRISPYAVMLLLSVAGGIVLLLRLNLRSGIPKQIAWYLALTEPLMIFFGAFGLTAILSGGAQIGFSSMGALAGSYAAVLTIALIFGQRSAGETMFRNCTAVLPLMYSISKCGCLLAGCCRGIPYAGAFCVEYTGKKLGMLRVFPVQLAESVVFLVIFVIGMLLLKRQKRGSAWLIVIACAISKGMLDFLRESHIGVTVSANQVLCLVTAAIGVTGYIFHRKTADMNTK